MLDHSLETFAMTMHVTNGATGLTSMPPEAGPVAIVKLVKIQQRVDDAFTLASQNCSAIYSLKDDFSDFDIQLHQRIIQDDARADRLQSQLKAAVERIGQLEKKLHANDHTTKGLMSELKTNEAQMQADQTRIHQLEEHIIQTRDVLWKDIEKQSVDVKRSLHNADLQVAKEVELFEQRLARNMFDISDNLTSMQDSLDQRVEAAFRAHSGSIVHQVRQELLGEMRHFLLDNTNMTGMSTMASQSAVMTQNPFMGFSNPPATFDQRHGSTSLRIPSPPLVQTQESLVQQYTSSYSDRARQMSQATTVGEESPTIRKTMERTPSAASSQIVSRMSKNHSDLLQSLHPNTFDTLQTSLPGPNSQTDSFIEAQAPDLGNGNAKMLPPQSRAHASIEDDDGNEMTDRVSSEPSSQTLVLSTPVHSNLSKHVGGARLNESIGGRDQTVDTNEHHNTSSPIMYQDAVKRTRLNSPAFCLDDTNQVDDSLPVQKPLTDIHGSQTQKTPNAPSMHSFDDSIVLQDQTINEKSTRHDERVPAVRPESFKQSTAHEDSSLHTTINQTVPSTRVVKLKLGGQRVGDASTTPAKPIPQPKKATGSSRAKYTRASPAKVAQPTRSSPIRTRSHRKPQYPKQDPKPGQEQEVEVQMEIASGEIHEEGITKDTLQQAKPSGKRKSGGTFKTSAKKRRR